MIKKILAGALSVAIMAGVAISPAADTISKTLGFNASITVDAASLTYTHTDGNTYTYTVSGSNATITSVALSSTAASIPSTINNYTVTNIGNYAFNENKIIKSVTIPKTVVNIGYMAFQNCSSLTKVTFYDILYTKLTTIGYRAFANCTSLPSISIPNNVNSIGESAFYNCASLTTVSFSWIDNTKLNYIGRSAFSQCVKLQSINIPSTVTTIKNSAFYNCTNLTSLTFKNTNNLNYRIKIEDHAFKSTGLTSLYIPKTVESIGIGAFAYCNNLLSMNIEGDGSYLLSVGQSAFASPSLPLITPSGLSGDKIYTPAFNVGSAKTCEGTQLIVKIYLNSPNYSWDSAKKATFNAATRDAYFEIKDQALAKYNKSITFYEVSYDVSITEDQMAAITGSYQTTTGSPIPEILQNYSHLGSDCNGVAYIFYINKGDGGSIASPAMSNDSKDYSVIYAETSNSRNKAMVMHELLHQYGTIDMYDTMGDPYSSPKWGINVPLSYPNTHGDSSDIMYNSGNSNVTIGPLDSYLIGWTNTIDAEDIVYLLYK